MAVFWDVAPRTFVKGYRRFRDAYCPHRCYDNGSQILRKRRLTNSLQGATSQKTAIFVFAAVRISELMHSSLIKF
jgi:hypothetical protein